VDEAPQVGSGRGGYGGYAFDPRLVPWIPKKFGCVTWLGPCSPLIPWMVKIPEPKTIVFGANLFF